MDIIEQFNLPPYVKGKSFAEASKSIMDKFKDRKDQTSMKTMAQLLGRLKDAQEFTKQQEAKSNSNDFFFGGQMGEQNKEGAVPGMGGGSGPGIGGYMQAATGALDIGTDMFGKVDPNSVDPDGKFTSAGAGALGGAMKGAQAGMAFGPWGAAIGGVIGGVGGIIGAGKQNDAINQAQANKTHLARNKALGNFANGGYIDPTDPKDKGKKKVTERPITDEEAKANSYKNSPDSMFTAEGLKMLGVVNEVDFEKIPNLDLGKYKDVGYFDVKTDKDGYHTLINTQKNPANPSLYKDQLENIQKLNPGAKIQRNNLSGYRDYANGGRPKIKSVNELEAKGYDFPSPESLLEISNLKPLNTTKSTESTNPSFLEKSGDWLNKNKYDIGRTAPIIANAAQLLGMKRPQKEQLAKLGNRYIPQLADEETAVNKINNSISSDLATEASGGSRSKAFANARALQRDKTAAVSNAYDSIAAQNRQEGRVGQQFNLGVDEFNTRTRQLESENFARDTGAYETEKSKLIGAIGENVGDFSTERMRDDMIKEMFDYTRKGEYIKSKAKGGYLDDAFKYMEESFSNRVRRKMTNKPSNKK